VVSRPLFEAAGPEGVRRGSGGTVGVELEKIGSCGTMRPLPAIRESVQGDDMIRTTVAPAVPVVSVGGATSGGAATVVRVTVARDGSSILQEGCQNRHRDDGEDVCARTAGSVRGQRTLRRPRPVPVTWPEESLAACRRAGNRPAVRVHARGMKQQRSLRRPLSIYRTERTGCSPAATAAGGLRQPWTNGGEATT